MAIINVDSSGNAPANTPVGSTVRTAGGDFTVVAPNTPGAKYNSANNLWSVASSDVISPVDYGQANSAKMASQNNALYGQSAAAANAASAAASAKQYDFNAREAQKTRDWQERLANTAHQREVKDLLAAGLNPVLSAMQGSGSVTPSGATASGSNYTGQMANVDTSPQQVFGSILSAVIGNQTSLDIAKIQAAAAIQTANISSAANVYASDNAYNASRYATDIGRISASETGSPVNRLLNSVLSGNSGSKVASIGDIFKGAFNLFESAAKKNAVDRQSKPSSW